MRTWVKAVASGVLISILSRQGIIGSAPGANPATVPTTNATDPGRVPTTVKQMLTPTKVSFKCDAISADAAVDAFSDQIGFAIRPAGEKVSLEGNPVTIHDENVSLLTVVKHVCEQGNVLVEKEPFKCDLPISFYARGKSVQPNWPCLFSKDTNTTIAPVISRLYNKASSRDAERKVLYIDFTFVTEPKVYLVGWYDSRYMESLVDDRGVSLIPPLHKDSSSKGFFRYRTSLGLREVIGGYEYPTEPNPQIKHLRAKFKVRLGFDVKRYDLSAAMNVGGQATFPLTKNIKAALTGVIPKTAGAPDQFELMMSIPGVKSSDSSFFQSDDFLKCDFAASDDQGRLWRIIKFDPETAPNGGSTMRLQVTRLVTDWRADRGKATKLTALIPSRIEDAVIPFEVDDLSVPR